ncbi:MAG: VanZ family protein [Lachnospiraceae bacterium]|nr:VanZ family protein [Lachnospiraceae bacterium]
MGFLKPEHKRWIVWILRGAFLLYLFCLMYLMFLSERYGRAGGLGMYRYNLVPFQEIKRYFLHRDRLSFETFFINIYGNVLAFMPFGFLLPVISRKDRRFWSIFLLSVALTLTLETTQLILQVGCFDVDDMILNTAGGVLGYWIYKLSYKLFQKIEKSWNLRN